MSGVQPSALSAEELVRYAFLKNVDGLPRDWCDALIQALDDALERLEDKTETT
jgi:hypothetical protein